MALTRTGRVAAGTWLALWLAGGAAAQDVSPAADEPVAVGVETDVASIYLFRGLVYSAGAVTQSKAWLSSHGLDLYGWTNVAMPAASGARTLDEVDLGVAYRFERGGLSIVPALDAYLYRLSDIERASSAATHTAEVSLAIAYSRAGTTLTSKHVVDARSYRGAYFTQLGMTHARRLGARSALEVAALAGLGSRRFTRSYIGPDVAAATLVSASVSLTRRIGRHAYVRPHAELSAVPDARLRAALTRPMNAGIGVAVGVMR